MKFIHKILIIILLCSSSALLAQDLVRDFSAVYKKYLERNVYAVKMQSYQYVLGQSQARQIAEGVVIKHNDQYIAKTEHILTIKEKDQILYVDQAKKHLYLTKEDGQSNSLMNIEQYKQLIGILAKSEKSSLKEVNGKNIYQFQLNRNGITAIEVVLKANEAMEKVVYYYDASYFKEYDEQPLKVETLYKELAKSEWQIADYTHANYYKKQENNYIPIGNYKNYRLTVR